MSSKRPSSLDIRDPLERLRERKRSKSGKKHGLNSQASPQIPSEGQVVLSQPAPSQMNPPPPPSDRSQRKSDIPTDEATADGSTVVTFPPGASVLDDPDTVAPIIDSLLLPDDVERLHTMKMPVVADICTVRLFQALQAQLYLKEEYKNNHNRLSTAKSVNSKLKSELEKLKKTVSSHEAIVDQVKTELEKVKVENARLEKGLLVAGNEIGKMKKKIEELEFEKAGLVEEAKDVAAHAMIKTRAELMQEFVEGKSNEWNPQQAFVEWEEVQELMKEAAAERDQDQIDDPAHV